jgi:lipid II:glycine glycyltransferase (peptidoglycan interpeptide bridge formation enzyme)
VIQFITKKSKFYSRSEIWFYNHQASIETDNTLFYHSFVKPTHLVSGLHEITSLEIDLTQHQDEIFNGFKPNYKNEIRRAKNEEITHEVYENPSQGILELYMKSYIMFHTAKKLEGGVSKERIKSFVKSNNFTLTTTSVKGKPICYHSYILDKGTLNTVILFQSHHELSIHDNKFRGFANKLHHLEDLLYFKRTGLKKYDFGGVDFINTENIAKFKCGFGGNLVKRYHFQETKGIYRILCAAKRLLNFKI